VNPTTIDFAAYCRDEQRRGDILKHPALNGIDFVEYEFQPPASASAPPGHVLHVHFLKPLPVGAYGLTAETNRILVQVLGGTRVVGIRVIDVKLGATQPLLDISVDREGDFSNYTLLLGWRRQPDGSWERAIADLDPQFSVATVNFRATCPVDFDCRNVVPCPPARVIEPVIDYLAKDYASFRQLLLDLVPQRNPNWLERSPADVGIALVELLAYTGDYLSYFQDAVANEAYLDTARQRVSAKRHARLVDYPMHDGRNAWAFVHVAVTAAGTVPQGAPILSRVTAPLRNRVAPPGPVIAAADLDPDAFETDPALADVRVFETTFPLAASPLNNEVYLHAWGNAECCLPRGTTSAYLYALTPVDAHTQQAQQPVLQIGDYLLFEEVKSPATGLAADADPGHRTVVRLTDVQSQVHAEVVSPLVDPAYSDQLVDGRLQVWQTGDTALPLVRVEWAPAEALAFPLCLSARPPEQDEIRNVSVARGNMLVADHGRTVREIRQFDPPIQPDQAYRLKLAQGPLTMQCQPALITYVFSATHGLTLTTARTDVTGAPGAARPAVALLADFPTEQEIWLPARDLLGSGSFDPAFVADIDNDGRATLRFGDGEYGRELAGAVACDVTYRVGNGRAGNVGAEALAHVVQGLPLTWPVIMALRNPLPARDGTDPETIEQVRQSAPAAFHAEQFRAVTEGDYVAAARKLPEVAGAAATFRWTGSWHTVYVGIDPRDPAALVTEAGGRTSLAPELEARVRASLMNYQLAGYDLEIRSARYVALEIDLDVCVAPDHFRGDVVAAVRRALSNHVNPDGTLGFFHPDRVTFGQPVYLSAVYAAVQDVTGVDSAFVTRFVRFGHDPAGELESGVLPIGPWEIARLDNDPNFMERGVLRITGRRGK
jgi:hypothetical protein